MVDFTLRQYKKLLEALKHKEFQFQVFEEFIFSSNDRAVVMRHDVDRCPEMALKMAETEHSCDVRASYHFRISSVSGNPQIIRAIAQMGHEIAYHYEDLSREARVYPSGDKRLNEAFISFKRNLDSLRQFFPVKVISMHGDPSQPVDNRDLWNHFSYRSEGVICEPYLDIDFESVLYLTDTGRRWNGSSTNFRDKVPEGKGTVSGIVNNYRTTCDIIGAIESGGINKRIILNAHPQRWTDSWWPWLKELVWQNVKNAIKYIISALR
jgi:hypothetical protein